MKAINKIYLLLASVVLFFGACTDPDDLTTATFKEGGLLNVTTPALNYVVGDGKAYTVEFQVFQTPSIYTNKIEVYSSFHTMDTLGNALSSNEILYLTIDVSETVSHFQSFDVMYADLIAGLQIDGVDLPANDTEMNIGDYWHYRIVSTTSEGNVFENYAGVDIAVSTRFAGTYTCADLSYYRIGVESSPYWLGHDIVIKSVDASTYFYDWGITIGWDGPLYFQIDGSDNITYPEEWDGEAQVLNGQPLITCDRNPGDFTQFDAFCPGANVAVRDDVEGKDQLIMTYGYYTGGSGPREFNETLIKQVN